VNSDPDPDPALKINADPDSDPGYTLKTKILSKILNLITVK
jgi:hypothetical protein